LSRLSEELSKIMAMLRELRYDLIKLAERVNDLKEVASKLDELPRDQSIVFLHSRCGLITSLEPLACELRKRGIKLEEGDQITWIVRKSKSGQPIIRAHLKKAKRSD